MGQEESRCLDVGDRRWWSASRHDDWTTIHLWQSLKLLLFVQRCLQMLQLLLDLTDKDVVTPDSHFTPGAKSFQRTLLLRPGAEHLSDFKTATEGRLNTEGTPHVMCTVTFYLRQFSLKRRMNIQQDKDLFLVQVHTSSETVSFRGGILRSALTGGTLSMFSGNSWYLIPHCIPESSWTTPWDSGIRVCCSKSAERQNSTAIPAEHYVYLLLLLCIWILWGYLCMCPALSGLLV